MSTHYAGQPSPTDAAAAATWTTTVSGWTITLARDTATGRYSASGQWHDGSLSVVGWGKDATRALRDMVRRIKGHREPQP